MLVPISTIADDSSVTEERGWAFRPPQRAPIPPVENHNWVINPVDAFILARLEQEGLRPSPSADGSTLIRRIYFDLKGLPPTPEETAAFLSDSSPTAYEQLVDRLLASPEYGERWAQHWLDVVRYADSDGFEYDDPRPHAWRYRDWVIDAFNSDKPFRRFIREQIAADELYPENRDAFAALGLHRLGPLRLNAGMQDKLKNRQEVLTEMVDGVGSAFLGLTFRCARCHDHKFDPISQQDYFELQAYFAATEAIDIPLVTGTFESTVPSIMVVRDRSGPIPATFVLDRGEPHQQLHEVKPAVPDALIGSEDSPQLTIRKRQTKTAAESQESTGRRSALAEWLSSNNHPLTARVFINRLWQHHFGRGIVATPNDFGAMGAPASHPELLDWLTAEFLASNGSIKHLQRLMVLSATYRQTSREQEARSSKTIDPTNELLRRANRRRLEAEVVRDALLAVAGNLNRTIGGPGVRLPLPPEIAKLQYKGKWQPDSDRSRHNQRSVYLFVKRNNRPPILESFDAPDTTVPCGRRTESTHAGQALMLLNSPLLDHQSKVFAARLMTDVPNYDPEKIINRAYQLALCRVPSSRELDLGRQFLAGADKGLINQLADYCLVIFNLDEFLYVD